MKKPEEKNKEVKILKENWLENRLVAIESEILGNPTGLKELIHTPSDPVPPPKGNWEEKFDKKFGYIEVGGGLGKKNLTSDDIKSFIRTVAELEFKRGERRAEDIAKKLPKEVEFRGKTYCPGYDGKPCYVVDMSPKEGRCETSPYCSHNTNGRSLDKPCSVEFQPPQKEKEHEWEDNPLEELLISSKEIENGVKSGKLIVPLEISDNDKELWEPELDNHLIHDPDHKWYWNHSCCHLLKKLKSFIRTIEAKAYERGYREGKKDWKRIGEGRENYQKEARIKERERTIQEIRKKIPEERKLGLSFGRSREQQEWDIGGFNRYRKLVLNLLASLSQKPEEKEKA